MNFPPDPAAIAYDTITDDDRKKYPDWEMGHDHQGYWFRYKHTGDAERLPEVRHLATATALRAVLAAVAEARSRAAAQ